MLYELFRIKSVQPSQLGSSCLGLEVGGRILGTCPGYSLPTFITTK